MNEKQVLYGRVFAEMAKPMLTASLHERFEQASRALISKIKGMRVREIEKHLLNGLQCRQGEQGFRNPIGVIAEFELKTTGAFYKGKFRMLKPEEVGEAFDDFAVFDFLQTEREIKEILRKEWYKTFAFQKCAVVLLKYLIDEANQPHIHVENTATSLSLQSISTEHLLLELKRINDLVCEGPTETLEQTAASIERYVAESSYVYIGRLIIDELADRKTKLENDQNSDGDIR